MILWHQVEDGPHRFLALQRKLAGVSKKVLSAQLKEREADGLIRKMNFASVPPHTEYSVSEYGHSARPGLDALCA